MCIRDRLYGESEGKDNKGLFPASAVFSTDLHSMGQYIQDGVRELFETVIQIEKAKYEIYIDETEDNADGLNFLAGKPMSYVNRKAFEGTISVSYTHLSASKRCAAQAPP